MANPNRKTTEQLIEEVEVEINQAHVNGWNFGVKAYPFSVIEKLHSKYIGRFNIQAAISSPKSIRYRQRDNDGENWKRGDYLFLDRSGGRMILPYALFKHLF